MTKFAMLSIGSIVIPARRASDEMVRRGRTVEVSDKSNLISLGALGALITVPPDTRMINQRALLCDSF